MLLKQPDVLHIVTALLLATALLAGCGGISAPTPTLELPTAVPTDIPPTPTTEPLAARVNGEGILLEDYNIELRLLQLALQETGQSLTAEEIYQKVLDDMIASALMAQEAEKGGYVLDAAALQARADELAAGMGGEEQLAAWKQANGYSDTAFMRALARNVKAAWQRDQIMSGVPTQAEQVRVKQILVQEETYAGQLLEQLKAGQDFTALASQIDPVTGGELGWFPRGFLFQPEVEEAAFSTEPGSFSGIIHSAVGYHILLVIEKDPARVLGPEARSTLQKAAVADWLQEKRNQSQIEILIP